MADTTIRTVQIPAPYNTPQITALLHTIANRLTDLGIQPDTSTNIDKILTIEANRRSNDPFIDWLDDDITTPPHDIYRLAGDDALCTNLSQLARHMRQTHVPRNSNVLLDILQRLVHAEIFNRSLRRRLNPDNYTTPLNVPSYQDYSFPDATTRTWRLHSDHFPEPPRDETPSARTTRIGTEDAEIKQNKKLLRQWGSDRPRAIDRWVTDPIARQLVWKEYRRIEASGRRERRPDGTLTLLPKAVVSDLQLSEHMMQPTRIPPLYSRDREQHSARGTDKYQEP